jgi:hypothetical protein
MSATTTLELHVDRKKHGGNGSLKMSIVTGPESFTSKTENAYVQVEVFDGQDRSLFDVSLDELRRFCIAAAELTY